MKLKYISSSALLTGLMVIASLENVSAVDEITKERVQREKSASEVSPKAVILKEKNESRGPTWKLDISETNGDVTGRDETGREVFHLYDQARKLLTTDLPAAYAYTTGMEKQESNEVVLSVDFDRPIEPKYLDTLVDFGLIKDNASDKWKAKLPPEKIKKLLKKIQQIGVDGGVANSGAEIPQPRITFYLEPGTIGTVKKNLKSPKFAREYARQAYTNTMVLSAVTAYNRALNKGNAKISDGVHSLPEGDLLVRKNGMNTFMSPKTKVILFDDANNAKNFELVYSASTGSIQTKNRVIIPLNETGGNLRNEFETTASTIQLPVGDDISARGFGGDDDSPIRIALLTEGDPVKKQWEQEGNAGWEIYAGVTAVQIGSEDYLKMEALPNRNRQIFLQFGDQNFDAAKAILLKHGFSLR